MAVRAGAAGVAGISGDDSPVSVPGHPEWKEAQPFKAALGGDLETVAAGGEHALLELVMASHAGNTTEEFEQIVNEWIATARHPKSGRQRAELLPVRPPYRCRA